MSREGEGHRSSVRCAIYTRKSTEEGLEQAFNTLDAQREACEAYIKSQAGEGWRGLAARYDDGGFSGGNIDRPALQRLLGDVEAGKVDTIVVYKVDRLTRSLMDFAKIVEKLDARSVSFVSVTQAFNTTTSMGRLTLNVLLSFAQFERDVTGERIRDKVAASKAKGIWMGGNLPLGYDLGDRMLLVNEPEARQVRAIFTRYLELGSVPALSKQLEAEGIRSKRWISSRGREVGGAHLGCGPMYYILQNRLYLGQVVHRGQAFDGEHDAIVSAELFEAVQSLLASNRKSRRAGPSRSASYPLLGLVCDLDGKPMGTTFGYGSGGKRYRYYVSKACDRKAPAADDNALRRVAGSGLEQLVLERTRRLAGSRAHIDWPEIKLLVRRVLIEPRSIVIEFNNAAVVDVYEAPENAASRLEGQMAPDKLVVGAGGTLALICDRRAVFRGGKGADAQTPAKKRQDPKLIPMLKQAHRLLVENSMSATDEAAHPNATAPPYQRQRRTMILGLIAPSIQRRILEGRLHIRAEKLIAAELPLLWTDQQGAVTASAG